MKIFTQSNTIFSGESVKKILSSLGLILLLLVSTFSFGQNPTVLYTSLTTTTPSPTNSRFGLTAMSGVFKQTRFQSNQTVSSGAAFWAFHQGSAGSPDYSNNWRPYTSGNLLSVNNYIPVGFANGARYNGGGGSDGQLPAITSGNYYTFNVTNNTGDNIMQFLETTYNPVTISSVTHAAGTFGSRLVTITTSGTPNASENIYIRYSTNSYSSSTLVQATGSGTTWTATIPWQSSAVSFYVYTSNKTITQINTDVTNNSSQTPHDMATLNLNNNAGANYSWTPPTGSIIVTSTGGTLANTPTAYSTFTVAAGLFSVLNTGTAHTGTVTALITADITTETGATTLGNSAAWTSLGIQPTGVRTISGTQGGGLGLIGLAGADNVNINGLNDGTNSLTINGLGTSTTAKTSTINFSGDAKGNTIQNCTIKGIEVPSSTLNIAVIYFGTGTSTGNTGNTLSNNIITAGASLPNCLIFSLGTSTAIPNTVTVTNNSISDWAITSTKDNGGIWLDATGNTGWTITGNKLFQSASRVGGTSTSVAINILSGTGYTVSTNAIGYSASNATGTFTVTAGTSARFVAIGLSLTAGGTATEVQGNTITAFNYATTSTAGTTSGVFTGIYLTSGNANIGTSTANLIGNASATNYIIVTAGTGALITGITSSSTGTVFIQNNTIASFATGGTAAIGYSFIGINTSGTAGAYTISSNIIGGSVANSITVGISGTTTTGSCNFTGISNSATGTTTISSNTIQNASIYGTSGVQLVYGINIPFVTATNNATTISGNTINNINQAGTAATSLAYGIIYQNRGSSVANSVSITGNTINNITAANTNATIASGALGLIGISFTPDNTTPYAAPTISGNTINTLSSTNATAIGINVAGIVSTATGGTGNINNNKIYDLRNAATGTSTTLPPSVSGVYIRNATLGSMTIHNNMISLGDSQTTNTQFAGIWNGLNATQGLKIYYNSISISGTASSGALPSFGFLRGDNSAVALTTTVDIQNNIFSNTRTGGSGKHYAIANDYGATASATGWGANASNYNVLNATAATVGYWTADKTFATWQTASSSDANSYSGITVTFSNVATGDLHLNMGATATALESSGIVISGLTTDYDAQTRPGGGGTTNGGGFAPDLGADEFDGKGLLPTITSLGTASGCVGAQLVINGTNLQGAIAANVKIGGTAVSSIVSNTGSVLTVVTGSGTTGTVTVLNAGGTATSAATYTINPTPTATWAATATAVCAGTTSSTLAYSATTNSPTTYSITWNASPANSFVPVTDQSFAGSAGGGTISIAVPAGATANTYTGNITVKASGCPSTTSTFTITVNPTPTTTWASASTSACFNASIQTTPLAYTATTNSPTTYSITWNGSPSNSFVPVTDASFAGTPGGGNISISIPAGTTANTYQGTITVKAANSCVSTSSNFNVVVNALPGATASSNSPVCEGSPLTLTATPDSQAGYLWTGPSYINSVTQTVTQNFNTLGTGAVTWTDNSTLPGWYLLQGQGNTTSPATAVASLTADTGTGTAASVYNYANTTATSDRALGSLPSNAIATAGSTAYYYGVKVTNTTGATVTTVAITYSGEEYRNNGTNAAQSLTVDYSTNATALTTASGTWTAIPALTFSSPVFSASAAAVDGNAAGKSTGITTTLTGLSIANGTSVWVRWADLNDAGNDHGLGIDDVSIVLSANSGQSPTVTSTAVSGNAGTYNLTVTGSNGCTSTASTLVLVSTLSTAPTGVTGTTTVCSGSGTTLTVAGGSKGTGAVTQWYTGSCGGTLVYTGDAFATGNLTSDTTYYVRYSGTCNDTTCTTVTVTVNSLSTAPTGATGTTTICSGTGTTLTVTGGSKGTGAVTQWYTGSCGGTLVYTGDAFATGNLTSDTTYYVRYSGTCNDTTCATVTVTVITTNVWTAGDGTTVWATAGNWSCGYVPTSLSDVVIDTASFYPIIASDVSVNSLTINSATTLNVTSGFDLNVVDAIVNNGTITMQNNSNLIQTNNVANSGSGTTIVNRDTAQLIRLDYVLWSSPVSGQQLLAFSPLTLTNRFYTFDGTIGTAGQYVAETATNNFVTGKGFLIRMPWNHPTAPGAVFNGVFTGGTAYNGTLNLTSLPSGKFYATGNPYPSTIDADQFIIDNGIGDDPLTPGDGLYFWRKTNNSATSSYATYTTAGGAQSGGDTLNIVPNGVIQVGEGFIVKVPSTSLTFNNGQRIGDNSNQFLKTTTTIERHRIWLNLSNSVSNINQMMVAYMTGATQNIDAAIDGRYINDNTTALNSLVNNGEFAIQGRSLPFDSSDVVPLAFKAASAGDYTITLDHVDGLFTGGTQAIYVKDNLTATYHDLNTGAYSFASESGTFNGRFEIVYALPLGVGDHTFTTNNVVIYNQNNEFVVKSGNIDMSSIKVFDVRGRLLEEKKDINATQTTIGSGLANEVLLVQITSVDGITVTKKVIR